MAQESQVPSGSAVAGCDPAAGRRVAGGEISRRRVNEAIDPGVQLELDAALLERFPAGYRHLAYAQTRIAFDVKADMPGLTGPEVEALYARGARWLDGGPAD